MGIGQLIDAVEESQNLAIVLEETNHRLVQSRQLLVRLVTARIVGGTAVEDIATAIAALVLGNAFCEREAIDTHHQWALGIILGERGRTILRMGLVGVLIGGLVAVGARGCSLNLLELGQLRESLEQVREIRRFWMAGGMLSMKCALRSK